MVGLAEATWHKNVKRPHVQKALEDEKEKFIREIEALAERHKARALEVAAHLLENAESEAVRARMVEFFRGESKAVPSVTINNTVNSGGYEYARPGQRIVEIEGSAQDVTPDSPET